MTLKLVKKPNTKKSTNNDVFSVQVDGKPVKNTTFEAYYEATKEQNSQTDTLLFRLSATAKPLLAGKGPADRRRHHRDVLTQRNTAQAEEGPPNRWALPFVVRGGALRCCRWSAYGPRPVRPARRAGQARGGTRRARRRGTRVGPESSLVELTRTEQQGGTNVFAMMLLSTLD